MRRTHDRDGGRGPLPVTALAMLRAIAKNAAKTNGDWRPAKVTAVPTTHGQALPHVAAAVPADIDVPADTPVYLVTMTGHFTGEDKSADAAGPKSSYLSLVINARSFWVMEAGLSRKAPPARPATLGPVTNIAW